MTSLGPAYIKLGQALSIRPDILSPVAMTELQKLCDKVLLHSSLVIVMTSMGEPHFCLNVVILSVGLSNLGSFRIFCYVRHLPVALFFFLHFYFALLR